MVLRGRTNSRGWHREEVRALISSGGLEPAQGGGLDARQEWSTNLRSEDLSEETEEAGEFVERWWRGLVRVLRSSAAGVGRPKKRAPPRNPWEEAMMSLAQTMPWKAELCWRDRSGAHINVLEFRGRRRVISRLARRKKNGRQRHFHLIDSRVGQGVAARGRSRSAPLLHECRLSVPDLLGRHMQVASWWGESAVQPMDEPSRGKRVLEAARPTPLEQEVLDGRRELVSRRTMRSWIRGRWRPGPPVPLRRLRCRLIRIRIGVAAAIAL